MPTGRQKLQQFLAGKSVTGTGAGSMIEFCFSCEQMFPNRMWLEEHSCPAASYICSCGTEFSVYEDMLEHNSKHQPGHQVHDHQSIMKRRFDKLREQDQPFKRFKSAGQGLWTGPSSKTLAGPSLKSLAGPSLTMASKSQVSIKSPLMSQFPMRSAQMSQASLLPNSKPPAIDVAKIFADSGAPTVDLWTVYHPVVLVNTVRQFDMSKKPYNCGKCGLSFMTKRSLTIHHNTHAVDKVFGCLGCGMLLSSRKTVPRYHNCNSPVSSLKVRLITARPMNYTKPNQADRTRSPIPRTSAPMRQRPHVTPSKALQLKTPAYSGPTVWRRPTPATSARPTQATSARPTLATSVRPTQATSGSSPFTCRVCHIPFETVQLLQRHKCTKAQEFVKQQQALSGKQFNQHRKVMSPYPSQMNGEKKPGPASVKANRDVAGGMGRGLGAGPVNGKLEVDVEDDCFIVESAPAKPAEVIYQLTSSVPVIKT